MGFYIRKGFNFGPLRLNLSRSGLGTSVGVKGFRIGLGPRGAYLHAGRGGLYYRRSLNPLLGRRPSARPGVSVQAADPLQRVESGDVEQMVDADAEEVLRELNRVQRRIDLAPLIGLLTIGATIGWWYTPILPFWVLVLTVVLGPALTIYARHKDVTRGTVVLHYTLDADSESHFNSLKSAFMQFAGCRGIWHTEAAGQTDDWKRNAGATGLIRRSAIRPMLGLPRRVKSNVEVPSLPAGRKQLYFFPDHIIVYEGRSVGAVGYAELRAQVSSDNFREDGQVPSDAQVLGSTWRYVNRNGSPDRRFASNREIPILQYGDLALESDTGLREQYQCSHLEAAQQFAQTLESWGRGSRVLPPPSSRGH